MATAGQKAFSKKALDMIDRLEDKMEHINTEQVKEIRNIMKLTQELEVFDKKLRQSNKDEKHRQAMRQHEYKMKHVTFSLDQRIMKLRHAQKMRLEQEHAEQVRRNIKLRHSLDQFSMGLNKVTSFLHGIGLRQLGGMGFGAATGVISRQGDFDRIAKDMAKAQKKETDTEKASQSIKAFFGADSQEFEDVNEELKTIRAKVRGLKGEQKDMEETPEGKLLMGKTMKKIAPLFSKISEFVGKHKAGIMISAISIGLLIGAFKKLLSVSPMLQKMLEVMNLAFNLILRPFGDFLGFILRPIAMMFLATVMPFFREAYPFLAQLGNAIGTDLADWIFGDGGVDSLWSAISKLFEAITPIQVLTWLFGERENNIEGGIGAIGAAIGAGFIGVVGVVLYSFVAGVKGLLKVMGLVMPKTVIPPTTTFTSSGQTSTGNNANNNALKNQRNNAFNNQTTGKAAQLKARIAGLQAKVTPNLSPALAGRLGRLIGTTAKGIPFAGAAILAAQIGFDAYRMLDPEGYEEMYNNAEWAGLARDIFMADPAGLNIKGHDMINTIDPMLGGQSFNDIMDQRGLVNNPATESGGDINITINNENNITNTNEADEFAEKELEVMHRITKRTF